MTGRILTLSVIFLATAALLGSAVKTESVPVREAFSSLPLSMGPWMVQELKEIDAEAREKLNADEYVARTYRDSKEYTLELFVAYYQSQRQGVTMHSPMNCQPGAGWNPVQRSRIDIPVAGAQFSTAGEPERTIRVNRVVFQKEMSKKLVLYWYQSHGRVVASEYWGKIYTVLDAIRINRTDAALVRITTPVTGMDTTSAQAAEAEAVSFIRLLFPLLERHLPT